MTFPLFLLSSLPPPLPLSLSPIHLWIYLSSITVSISLNLVTFDTVNLSACLDTPLLTSLTTLAPGSPLVLCFLSQAPSQADCSSSYSSVLVFFSLLCPPWIILTTYMVVAAAYILCPSHMVLQLQSLSQASTHIFRLLLDSLTGLYYIYLKFCMSNIELCHNYVLIKIVTYLLLYAMAVWVNWTLYKYFIKFL